MPARKNSLLRLLYHPASAWVALAIGCVLSLAISKAYLLSVEKNFEHRFAAQSDRLAGQTHDRIQGVAFELRRIASAYAAFSEQGGFAWHKYIDSLQELAKDTAVVDLRFARLQAELVNKSDYLAHPVVHDWLRNSLPEIWTKNGELNAVSISPAFRWNDALTRGDEAHFAMIAPVLDQQGQHAGWLLARVSSRKLVNYAAPSDGSIIDLQLFHGQSTEQSALLYGTNRVNQIAAADDPQDVLTLSRPLLVEGHPWTLRLHSTARVGSALPSLLIGANLFVHLLLVVIIFGILYSHKFVRLKGEQTAEKLRQSKRGLEKEIEKRTEQLQDKVDEAEELVAQLTNMNDELRQFTYVASHDLNEPLRMIVSFTDLLYQKYSDNLDDTAKQYMSISAESARRMQAMLGDLLDYTKLENNTERYTHVQCGAELECVLIEFCLEIENNAIEIVHDKLPVIVCNRARFVALIKNLIGNALRYRRTDCRTLIQISVEQEDDHWVFSVKDNGIGIEERYFDRIFEPFKRLHAYHEFAGTGLGLAICRKVAESWGGELWLESQLGQGSTFYFTIPKNLNPALHHDDAANDKAQLHSSIAAA